MLKATKKLFWMPSMHATSVLATGGGGGGGTMFTASPALNADDFNPNTTFRVRVPVAVNSASQIRFTIQPGSINALSILNASFGKWDGQTAYTNTTATPIEVKFGGNSGFTSATTPQTSDWTNLSGLSITTSDRLILIFDLANTGNNNAYQRYNNANTGVFTQFKTALQSWNQSDTIGIGYGDLNNTCYCISSVETQ